MGEVAEQSEVGGGLPVFLGKTGLSEYLQRKYSDSPRPSGTPLINVGGKKFILIGGLAIYMAAVSAPISSSESWVMRPSSTR